MVTLLHKAAHVWNADGMQALLALGADVSVEDQLGRQPLYWAVLGKYFQDNRYRQEAISIYLVDGLKEPEVSRLANLLAR